MKSDTKKITVEQCKDSGLALVLICLICFFVWDRPFLLILATVFLVVAMTYPLIYQPFARLWFGLSTALGTVVSKIILAVLFYGLVLPVGLVRRAMGKDAMQVKAWRQGNKTVFRVRDHRFEAKDLEHPY
jgi:hypothetical protein